MTLKPASKRAIEAAETRRSIVMGAKAAFAARPYESVTMREIADLAGCSTGAIFANWPGKDALFAEVMGRPPITDAMGAKLLTLARRYGANRADADRIMGVTS
jgi:AcrR family transcriptional regulator